MAELRVFHYSLVRYTPDRLRGETVNLGVIVVDESASSSASAFLPRFRARIRSLDPWVSVESIERLVDTLKERCGHQGTLGGDARITSKRHLSSLSYAMKNQLRVSEPLPYRAISHQAATNQLFAELVSPQRRPPVAEKGMTLRQLRVLIRRTLRSWGSETLRVEEDKLQKGPEARHYADFWLESGLPVAAFIAIPDDPGERDIAWARRDSVPTIASEFTELNPEFRTVVVFPPNGHVPPRSFVSETESLLEGLSGVIVTHVDELADHRAQFGTRLL